MIDLTAFKRIGTSAYLVDVQGRVFSEKRNKLMSPSFNQSGHRVLNMRMPDGTRKTISLHRAVRELHSGVKLHHLSKEAQLHARQRVAAESAQQE